MLFNKSEFPQNGTLLPLMTNNKKSTWVHHQQMLPIAQAVVWLLWGTDVASWLFFWKKLPRSHHEELQHWMMTQCQASSTQLQCQYCHCTSHQSAMPIPTPHNDIPAELMQQCARSTPQQNSSKEHLNLLTPPALWQCASKSCFFKREAASKVCIASLLQWHAFGNDKHIEAIWIQTQLLYLLQLLLNCWMYFPDSSCHKPQMRKCTIIHWNRNSFENQYWQCSTDEFIVWNQH